jgi:hypothetical protein
VKALSSNPSTAKKKRGKRALEEKIIFKKDTEDPNKWRDTECPWVER